MEFDMVEWSMILYTEVHSHDLCFLDTHPKYLSILLTLQQSLLFSPFLPVAGSPWGDAQGGMLLYNANLECGDSCDLVPAKTVWLSWRDVIPLTRFHRTRLYLSRWDREIFLLALAVWAACCEGSWLQSPPGNLGWRVQDTPLHG